MSNFLKNDELYQAIESSSLKSIEYILQFGVDPNKILEGHEMSVMHLAVGFSNNSPEIVHLLLKYGGDPNSKKCSEKLTPLQLSIHYEFDKIVDLLLRFNGNPYIEDEENKNSFQLAEDLGNEEIIKILEIYKDRTQVHSSNSEESVISIQTVKLSSDEGSFYSCHSQISDESIPTMIKHFTVLMSEDELLMTTDGSSLSSSNSSVSSSSSSSIFEIKEERENYSHEKICGKIIKTPPENILEDEPPTPVTVIPKTPTCKITTSTTPYISCFNSPTLLTTPPKSILKNNFSNYKSNQGQGYSQTPSKSSTAVPHKTLAFSNTPIKASKFFESPDSPVRSPAKDFQNYRTPTAPTATLLKIVPDEKNTPSNSKLIEKKSDESPFLSPIKSPTKEDLAILQLTFKKLNIGLPVTESTYSTLQKYVEGDQKISNLMAKTKSDRPKYSQELLAAINDLSTISEFGDLQVDVIQDFLEINGAGSSANGKYTSSKSFYNYFLLNPKLLKGTNFSGNHLKSDIIGNSEKFECFLKSIFYIGKGSGRRPIKHLTDAREILYTPTKRVPEVKRKLQCNEDKINTILNIWKSGFGVILLSVFHHSSEKETSVYEAAMIDSMSLEELDNKIKGTYSGTKIANWSQKAKKQFGAYLLYKCFCSFVVDNGKQFFPQDV